jgi:hypothetical protein
VLKETSPESVFCADSEYLISFDITPTSDLRESENIEKIPSLEAASPKEDREMFVQPPVIPETGSFYAGFEGLPNALYFEAVLQKI